MLLQLCVGLWIYNVLALRLVPKRWGTNMKHSNETIKASRRVHSAMLALADAFDAMNDGQSKGEANYWRCLAHDTLLSLELHLCRCCGLWTPDEGWEPESSLCFCCLEDGQKEADEEERGYSDIMTNNAKESVK